jgi:hypothetical protein
MKKLYTLLLLVLMTVSGFAVDPKISGISVVPRADFNTNLTAMINFLAGKQTGSQNLSNLNATATFATDGKATFPTNLTVLGPISVNTPGPSGVVISNSSTYVELTVPTINTSSSWSMFSDGIRSLSGALVGAKPGTGSTNLVDVVSIGSGLTLATGSTPWVLSATGGGGSLSATDIDTSAELKAILTDETGSGALVFGTSPTLVTPTLGVATATSVSITDDAYDATTWDGSTLVPTKNAVRDKIEALGAGGLDFSATVTTSDATMTSLYTKPIGTNLTYFLSAYVVGGGPTNSAGYELKATGNRVGTGNLTLTTNSTSVHETDAGFDAHWEVANSTNAVIKVTGKTSETVNWYTKGFFANVANGAPGAAGGGGGPTVAPVYLAGSAHGTFNAAVSTLTATVTVPSGTDRLMIISVGQGNNSNAQKAITSVTYNGGQTATAITGASIDNGHYIKVTGYYIVAPTVASGVSLTVIFASAPDVSCIQCATYTGAAQSGTIFGTAVTGFSTSTTTATLSVTTGTGQINVGLFGTDADGAITIGGSAGTVTERKGSGTVNGDLAYAISDATGTGTFQYTWSLPDNGWAAVSIPINGSN